LAVLGERLDDAARGHGQVVCVVGEAGVGKSRFVYELTRVDRCRGWRVVYGRTISSDIATPWQPITELLRRHFDVDESDAPLHVRDRIATEATPTKADLPALLTLLNAPVDDAAWRVLDPRQRRQRLVDAVTRLLTDASQRRPLLVVLEDLHWADTETRAVVDRLVDRLPTAALLLVVTCRPGLQHPWGLKSYYTQLHLDVLSTHGAAEMLQGLLGDHPTLDELKKLLIVRTEGNPFFLEETVRGLIETGALASERGGYALAGAIPSVELPATVQAILAARIARLAAADRHLLHVAAVIGKDAPFSLVQKIAGTSESDLKAALDRLQASELVYEVNAVLEPTFTFKHTLTHEAAYASIPMDARRELHAATLRAIERLYGSVLTKHMGQLGLHAAAAELWHKAARYCREAGQQVFERSASAEAAAWFDRALAAVERLPDGPDKLTQAIDLRLDLHGPAVVLGELDSIAARLNEARHLAETLGDSRRRARVLAYLTNVLSLTGELRGAVEAGEAALSIPEANSDPGVEIIARNYLIQARFGRGEFSRVVPLLRSQLEAVAGLPIGERFGMPSLAAVYPWAWGAFTMAELGRFQEGEASGLEGLRIATEAKHPYSQIFAGLGLCYFYDRKGMFARAIEVGDEALTLCRTADVRNYYSLISLYLGLAYAGAARRRDALALLQEASDLSIKQNQWRGFTASLVGEALFLLGDVDEADRYGAAAFDFARVRGLRATEAWALRLLGDTQAARGESLRAAESYLQGLRLADALDMRPLVAHCHLGLGKLYRHTGKREQAREQLTTATAMYRDMDMGFWLEQAEAALREAS
jgi:tetratricopeptide (TPR) repeat protein